MASDDPDFERKAADVIGLYVNPPQHAAVFCVDEKTAIQALDRLDPVLPLSAGRASATASSTIGIARFRSTPRSTPKAARSWVRPLPTIPPRSLWPLLRQIVALQPRGREIHIIADNLSAHKTKRVARFLADHPKVHLHFTPTYSSWLNQVELWFARIERDVVARGVFTSVNDLARKLMRYIRHHNQHAAPIKWAYRDFSHRIIATFDLAVTGH